MKRFVFAFIFMFLSGCATVPPAQYNYDSSRAYSKAYDEVWQSIVDYFAKRNTPIKTIEKASGIIATEDLNVPFQYKSGTIKSSYCDCGTPGGLNTYKQLLGRYNVFVKKVSDSETSVQVNTNYRASIWFGNNFLGWVNCASTGDLESSLHSHIEHQMKIAKGGIGVQIKDGTIISFLENSPAKEAGLMINDKIVEVNNIPVKSLGELISLLRGEPNTEVNLTVIRDDRKLNFIIKRQMLNF